MNKILLVHQNFPAQFLHLAPALVNAGYEVQALTMQKDKMLSSWKGIYINGYQVSQGSTSDIHPWLADFETKIIRAEAAFNCALAMKQQGFNPDLIIAHSGWGESLFLKEVWPKSKLTTYCEYFYKVTGGDIGFDPEFEEGDPAISCRIQLRNINHMMHLPQVVAGLSPTKWQADTFPESFRKKISVIHEGVDTQRVAPNPDAYIEIENSRGRFKFKSQDQILTFISRNLEPCRGYHIFMRALPMIMEACPDLKIVVVGGDDVSYGKKPISNNGSWKNIFLKEVGDRIDLSRVFFLGKVSYEHYLSVLQISSVHIYLTYPFVLSWSLMEAMSVGCAIVASDTEPVKEVIKDNENGMLLDFFDYQAIADKTIELLLNPDMRARLGKKARADMIKKYDLNQVCLPKQLKWVESLLK